MNAKPQTSPAVLLNQDDAPELTDEFFERADEYKDGWRATPTVEPQGAALQPALAVGQGAG